MPLLPIVARGDVKTDPQKGPATRPKRVVQFYVKQVVSLRTAWLTLMTKTYRIEPPVETVLS